MSTTSPNAAPLAGIQTPRHETGPSYSSSAGKEAVELASEAGLHLDPWQQRVLENSLGERPDGTWSANEVGLIVPRQCGKGAILEARELAGLFLLDERLILHSAQLFPTAIEGFRRILGLIENNPAFASKVLKVSQSHGAEGIEMKSGARLRFVARSRAAIRGFSGDLLILDEAYDLSDAALEAMLPTLSARPNAQIWYTSSAPLPESDVLRRICIRGRRGASPRMYYAEWCADNGADPNDRRAWAQANPGLGIRLSEEFTERELGALSEEGFLRERLGVWQEDDSASQIMPLDLFHALNVGVREMSEPVFAAEVSLDRHSTIAACWDSHGRKHVEIVEDRPGTDWLVPRLAELSAQYDSPLCVVDSSTEAGALAPDLERAGVRVLRTDSAGRVAACGQFVEAVTTGSLSWNGDPALLAALQNARWREFEGARVFSRRKSAGPISALYAATLALHGLSRSAPVGFVML